MKDGFVKVAALTPKIRVADCAYNTERICERIDEACRYGASILVFPELCITGYTCADLFWQETLLLAAKESLKQIVEFTKGKKALIFVGLPWEKDGKLYNVAAVICDGHLLGLVPKRYLPNYNEFYELRHFTDGWCRSRVEWTEWDGRKGSVSACGCCFACSVMLTAGGGCGDRVRTLWAPAPPSVGACAGRGDGDCQSVGKRRGDRGRMLISEESGGRSQSARLLCRVYLRKRRRGGVFAGPDCFRDHNVIAENGHVLCRSPDRFAAMRCICSRAGCATVWSAQSGAG